MVTKYDAFLFLAERNEPAKVRELVAHFRKRRNEYANFYRLLTELVRDKLAAKDSRGFAIRHGKKPQLLHRFLSYCVSNGVNYNELLDKKCAQFIAKALLKAEFAAKDFALDPKTLRKYVGVLSSHGFLIKVSSKPFKARLPWNHALSILLQYHNIPVLVRKGRAPNLVRWIST